MPSKKEIITKLIHKIQDEFNFQLTADKYKMTDIYIRPKSKPENDLWLRVQIRLSESERLLSYYLNYNVPSFVFIGMSSLNEEMFIFSREEGNNVSRVEIRENSKYNKFRYYSHEVCDILKKYYCTYKLVSLDEPKYSLECSAYFKGLTYHEIKQRITNLGCVLLTDQKEHNHIDSKTLLDIKLKCDHVITSSLSSLQKRKHLQCDNCIHNSMTDYFYDKEARVAFGNIVEHNTFQYLIPLLSSIFEVKKTHEGCRADMVIRPIGIQLDEWLGIQLKTRSSVNVSQYSFSKLGNYKDEVIILTTYPQPNIWVFEPGIIKQNSLSIGLQKSKYDIYKTPPDFLGIKLQEIYSKGYNKQSLEVWNTPITICQKIEHELRLRREKWLGSEFTIDYPQMDGAKFDVIINGYKIQDKFADKAQHANSFYVKFDSKYIQGDNSFYWINKHDGSFYLIPEEQLLNTDKLIKRKITLGKRFAQFHYWFDADSLESLKCILCLQTGSI
jgi:hypothetical protein